MGMRTIQELLEEFFEELDRSSVPETEPQDTRGEDPKWELVADYDERD